MIYEDVDNDYLFSEIAQDGFNSILAFIHDNADDLKSQMKLSDGGFYVKTLHDVANFEKLMLVLHRPHGNMDGAYGTTKSGVPIIYLMVLDHDGNIPHNISRIVRNKRSVIVHELIHALDKERASANHRMSYDANDVDFNKYANDPFEKNAMFHEMLLKIKNITKDVWVELAKNPVQEVVNQFYEFQFNKFDKFLTNKSKKAIKKRIYSIVKTEFDQLEPLTEVTKEPLSYYKKAETALAALLPEFERHTKEMGWAGDFLQSISDTLKDVASPIAPDWPVRVTARGSTIGGALSVYANDGELSPMVSIRIPTSWINNKIDFLIEYEKNYKAIATTFAHEIGHAVQLKNSPDWHKAQHAVHRQQAFDEKRDLEWQRAYAKQVADNEHEDYTLEQATHARAFLYYTKKYEIEMQAYSAAQELWEFFNMNEKEDTKEIMDMLKSWDKLKNVPRTLGDDLPHLSQYIDFVRNGNFPSRAAYKRFLKKTYQYIQEMRKGDS